MFEALQSLLTAHGAQFRALPVSRLPQLKADIHEQLDAGALSRELVKPYKSLQEFAAPSWAAKGSIAVMAVPSHRSILTFNISGKRIEAVVPPTYISSDARAAGRKALEEATGKRVEWAFLPVKTVAARSGLARYGRNNIAYVEGLGSYARLDAFYTEADLGLDHWQEREAMPQCSACRLCLEACPTKAIMEDRFLVRAETCLTYFTEFAGPFPEWVQPQWHNAAVGCMTCQEACPVNKPHLEKVDRTAEFTAEETRLVMEGAPLDGLPGALTEKLKALEIDEYYELLPRNLGALANRP